MDLEHLTPDGLAQRWQKTTRFLAQLRVKGSGPPYLKIGKDVRYRIEDIESFERESLRVHTSQDFLSQSA